MRSPEGNITALRHLPFYKKTIQASEGQREVMMLTLAIFVSSSCLSWGQQNSTMNITPEVHENGS